jgi:hypothetical protein
MRFALADSVFACSAVAVAAVTVWFRGPQGADADGLCALLSDRLRRQHARCRSWAQKFIGATTEGRYAVLAVVMQKADRARVRVLIDGDHFFRFFVRRHERWRFDEIRALPLR